MVNKMHHHHLSCEICERIFQYPSQLQDHMLIHTRIRRFVCNICGMKFLKDHHLKAHSITHSPIKPHVCPMCGRCFSLKANMERHTLVHSEIRRFKCEQCGKLFAQPQTLKMHMVCHAEVKPFSCNICGKSLSRAHNLRAHMAMHQNNKAHKCTECGSSFTLRGNMQRHQREKHGAVFPTLQSKNYTFVSPTMLQYSQASNNEEQVRDFIQSGKKRKYQPKNLAKCKEPNDTNCVPLSHVVYVSQSSTCSSETVEQNTSIENPMQPTTNRNVQQAEFSPLYTNSLAEHKPFAPHAHSLHGTSPFNATLPQMFGAIPVTSLMSGYEHSVFPSMTNVNIKLQALHAAIDDLAGKLGPSHDKVSALHNALDDMVTCHSKGKNNEGTNAKLKIRQLSAGLQS